MSSDSQYTCTGRVYTVIADHGTGLITVPLTRSYSRLSDIRRTYKTACEAARAGLAVRGIEPLEWIQSGAYAGG